MAFTLERRGPLWLLCSPIAVVRHVARDPESRYSFRRRLKVRYWMGKRMDCLQP